VASRRILRVNELLREELAELLRRETEDPELQTLISITEVDTSPDLRVAKVYVSTLGDDEEMVRVLRRMRHAARFFRRELARRVNLRHTPELDFQLDPSISRGARILKLLGDLQAEQDREQPAKP
jgi:ribosome-binding factor A